MNRDEVEAVIWRQIRSPAHAKVSDAERVDAILGAVDAYTLDEFIRIQANRAVLEDAVYTRPRNRKERM